MLRLSPLLTASLAILLLAGCADDPEPATDTAGDLAADVVTDTTSDIGGDTTSDIGSDTTVEPDVGSDLGPPEVTPVDPLPQDPAFNESYVGVGDGVVTTLVETSGPLYGWEPYLTQAGDTRVPLSEFGRLHPQPGEPHMLRNQLVLPDTLGAAGLLPGTLPATARSVFYGFMIADPQLVDSDSPVQIAKNIAAIGLSLPAYRPQGELMPQMMDAVLRTANRFQVDRPFDLLFVLGDTVENAQTNEQDWFFTIMSGGEVLPDSGERDDVVPGPGNDAYDPFVAQGVAPGTPWVGALGNHDILLNGNFPPGLIREANDSPVVLATLGPLLADFDLTLPAFPTATVHPAYFPHAMRSAFRVRMDEWFHPNQLPNTEELLALEPRSIPADPAREPYDVCGWVKRHRGAPGEPAGHGYSAQNEADCTGWFTYDPIPGVPLRIISLPLGPVEGGDKGILAPPYDADGPVAVEVGDPRYDQVAFLEAEIARAEDEDVALIVMSHQASDSIVTTPALSVFALLLGDDPVVLEMWERYISSPPSAVSGAEFRELLSSSPNVIAHIAGHNHKNRIRAVCPDGTAVEAGEAACEDDGSGETGYWEVFAPALVAFPHQGRFIELVHIEGQLAGLYITNLDPRIPEGSFAELGRFISRSFEATKTGGLNRLGAPGDRNVFLPLQLPAGVAARLTTATLADKIQSETTLLEEKPALPQLPEWVQ